MNITDVAQQATDAWNAKDLEGFLSCYDAEHEVVAPNFTGKGEQGLRDFWALWNGAFPDNHLTTQIMVAEADTVAQAATFQGTHTGPPATPDGGAIPPTGRAVSAGFSSFETVRDGRIVRSLSHFDQLDLLGQLGLPPAAG